MHPIAARLVAYLIRNQFPDQERVFVNARGTPWTRYALSCRMKRLRSSLGLPADCKTYGLRHKFGTDGVKNGVEIKTLSVLMGHTNTRTTERYVHIDNEYKLLGDAVGKVFKKHAGQG